LDEENRKRQEKYGWAWHAEQRANALKAKQIETAERLLIEAPKAKAITQNGEQGAQMDEQEQHGLEVVVVAIDEEPVADVMAPKKDTRSASVDGWAFKNRNALMFPPDADISPYDAGSSSTIPSTARGEPKEIKYANTRLPEQSEAEERHPDVPPSPTRSRVEAAIAGEPYHATGPKIRGFSLVPVVPAIAPSDLRPKEMKELMTWGTLQATPRVLSEEEPVPTPSTPFRLAEPTSRDVIARKLSTTASRSLTAKAALMSGATPRPSRSRSSMPPPAWTRTPRGIHESGLLTPAARRLLDRTASSRRAEVMSRTSGWERKKAEERDMARVRWTPSPRGII